MYSFSIIQLSESICRFVFNELRFYWYFETLGPAKVQIVFRLKLVIEIVLKEITREKKIMILFLCECNVPLFHIKMRHSYNFRNWTHDFLE